MDELVWKANFGDEQTAKYAQREIRKAALNQGVYPASIHNLYINRKYIPEKFTVPAINVRELTYDFAQTIFKVAKELNVGTLIFEIARSENLHDLMLKVSKKRGELLKLITTDD